MKKTLVFIFFFIHIHLSHGQEYQKIGHREGLLNESVFSTFQDDQARVWVSTESGIYRFNGNYFDRLSMNDPIAESNTYGFFPDDSGKLWLRTGRFNLVYYEGDSLKHLLKYPKAGNDYTSAICQESGGRLWFATNGQGVYSYEKGVLIHWDKSKGLFTDDPSHIWVNSYGVVFVLGNENIYALKQDHFEQVAKLPVEVKVFRCKELDGKHLIFAYGSEAYLFNSVQNTLDIVQFDRTPEFILHIQTINKRLWISTVDGVYQYRLEQSSAYFEQKLLDGILTNYVMEDHEGNVWISSLEKGLFLFSRYQLQGQRLPIISPDRSVYSMLSFTDRLLLGSRGSNLYQIKDKKAQVVFSNNAKVIHGNQKLRNLQKDKKQRVYLNFDGFLNILSPDLKLIHSTIAASRASLIHSSNTAIIATTGKLIRLDTSVEALNNHAELRELPQKVLSYASGNDLIELEDSSVLIGTSSGLFQLDKHLKKLTPLFEESIHHVTDLEVHPMGVVIATLGQGAFLWNKDTLISLGIKDGLSSNYLYCLSSFNEYSIFVGTANGLNLITFKKYLDSVEVISGFQGMPHKQIDEMTLHNDTVWATTGGVLYFQSISKLLESGKPVPLPLTLNAFRVRGKSLNGKTEFKLAYDENDIEFEFTAISYSLKRQIRYRYRLIGSDSSWKYSSLGLKEYSNLEPGNYTFEVSACLFGHCGSVKTVSFRIYPPYWKTWWFILCSLAALGLFIFFVFYKGILVYNKDVIRSIFKTLFYRIQHDRYLLIKNVKDGHKVKVKISDLCYLESQRNNVVYYLKNGQELSTRITMKETEAMIQELAPGQFIRVHRSFLVNLHHVEGFRSDSILVNRHAVPCGKLYKNNHNLIKEHLNL